MDPRSKGIAALILRLMVGLALLGWPRVGAAQGTWSVISLPQQPGDVIAPSALAVDGAGSLYVAESGGHSTSWIQKRDAQGNWSAMATYGAALGQVALYGGGHLAADATGNLYVADQARPRIQKRHAQGNWSVIATYGAALGQVAQGGGGHLAADAAGNLYVSELWSEVAGNAYVWKTRIQKRDAQGKWSLIATGGAAPGQLGENVGALAVDTAGNLYVVDYGSNGWRIQKRDAQGSWSLIAPWPAAALAVDTVGDLYVANGGGIQKRDAQGNWSVIATPGRSPGQVDFYSNGRGGLAVDAVGNLYVADTGDRDDFARIQKRDAQGNWFTIATTGSSPDETHWSRALTADGAGNLYVRDAFGIEKRAAQGDWSRIATLQADALATDTAGNLYVASRGGLQKRDAQGNWSVIAAQGTDIGQVVSPTAVAVDTRGNLLVSDVVGGECGGASYVRIQKRDPQGNWSVIATFQFGTEFSVIDTFVCALAVDTAGNLYVAYGYALGDGNGFHYEIARRDAQGNWSVIATERSALGQVTFADGGALAVDAASNLYVVDDDAYQVQKYTLAR